MIEIGLDEIKLTQLDILQALHEFCEENEIKYTLGCGTLLGAVRHQGYIPWDDDIDVYLLRADYEQLIVKFPKSYKNDFELICLERDKEWSRPYAKAFNNKTILFEDTTEKKRIGIGIDVYPIDYVPDNEDEWIKYNSRRLILQGLFSLKLMRINKNRSLLKNVVVLISHIILLPISHRKIAKFIDKYAQKYNGKFHSYLCECVQGIITGKNRFKAKDLDSVVDCVFEDRVFKIMAGYHDYLINAYGDYMTPPPIEKQVSTHETEAYWID